MRMFLTLTCLTAITLALCSPASAQCGPGGCSTGYSSGFGMSFGGYSPAYSSYQPSYQSSYAAYAAPIVYPATSYSVAAPVAPARRYVAGSWQMINSDNGKAYSWDESNQRWIYQGRADDRDRDDYSRSSRGSRTFSRADDGQGCRCGCGCPDCRCQPLESGSSRSSSTLAKRSSARVGR